MISSDSASERGSDRPVEVTTSPASATTEADLADPNNSALLKSKPADSPQLNTILPEFNLLDDDSNGGIRPDSTSDTNTQSDATNENDKAITTQEVADGVGGASDSSDGSKLERDSRGRVTAISYANGDSRQFKYDEGSGKVSEVVENGKVFTVKDSKLYGPDDKPTGATNPVVSPDGSYSVNDSAGNFVTIYTDRTSSLAKPDGSTLEKNTEGRLTAISYPDGTSRTFGYDQGGKPTTFTDTDGKTYSYKGGAEILGIRFGGSFVAEDGTTLSNLKIANDGTVQYTAKDGTLVSNYTTGNSERTSKSSVELAETARQVRESAGLPWADLDKKLEGLSAADRSALAQLYKERYGSEITDDLKGRFFGIGKAQRALGEFADAELRTTALRTFSNKDELAAANAQMDDFDKRAARQGLSTDEIAAAKERAAKQMQADAGSKSRGELLKGLEATLGDVSPSIDSLAAEYGIKYDTTQKDGKAVYSFYVLRNNEKVPVLETSNDKPWKVEAELRQARDKQIADLEKTFKVAVSKDGEKADDKAVRAPNFEEIENLRESLYKSQPDQFGRKGEVLRINYLKESSGPASYAVIDSDNPRTFIQPGQGYPSVLMQELAHNGQTTSRYFDDEKLRAEYGQRQGFFQNKGGEWILEGKNENEYYKREEDKDRWVQVDKEGKRIEGKEPISNEEAAKRAKIPPNSWNYFANPYENLSVSLTQFRLSEKERADLYKNRPELYAITKEYDQRQVDAAYGKNTDGSSKYIRNPQGYLVANNDQNRAVVANYESGFKTAQKNSLPPSVAENPDSQQRSKNDEAKKSLEEEKQPLPERQPALTWR